MRAAGDRNGNGATDEITLGRRSTERPAAAPAESAGSTAGRAAGTSPRDRPARARVAGLTLAAGVVYGGWAFVANVAHGASPALRAGAVQALSSATTTLVISGGIEALRRRLGTGPRGLLLAATLPPTATSLVHLAAHLVNGTPELLRTIAPSVLIGYAFAAAYALGSRRLDAATTPPGRR